MEYDRIRLRERIQFLETCLKQLHIIQNYNKQDFLADFRNVETTKHLLQIAIEAMMDISAHILARNRLPTPQEGAEIFRKLGEAGFIPLERVQVYGKMVRFRNLVVHVYQEIESERVYEILHSGVSDIQKFIKEILKLVSENQNS